MNVWYAILFFIILKLTNVRCGIDKKQDTSTSNQPFTSLPLVMINKHHTNTYTYPKKITSASWISGGRGFGTGTQFSDDTDDPQVFMCSLKNSNQRNTSQDASAALINPQDKYCSYPIRFVPSDKLKCIQEPEPFVRKFIIEETNSSNSSEVISYIPCGPEKKGKMYTFVYHMCTTKTPIKRERMSQPNYVVQVNSITHRSVFEIYRFCINEESKEILYMEYKIMAPGLLSDNRLKDEREREYEMKNDDYGYFDSYYEALKQEYDKLRNLTEEDSSDKSDYDDYEKILNLYKVQKLVHPDDFALSLWRKPIYHYLNVDLMRAELIEVWEYIGKLIRQDAIQLNREYDIFVKTYKLPQDQNSPIFHGQLQIPDIWMKIIHYSYSDPREQDVAISYKALAVVMNNNFDLDTVNTFFQNNFDNKCVGALDNLFPEVSKFIKCSSAKDVMKNFFDRDILVDHDLEVNLMYQEIENVSS